MQVVSLHGLFRLYSYFYRLCCIHWQRSRFPHFHSYVQRSREQWIFWWRRLSRQSLSGFARVPVLVAWPHGVRHGGERLPALVVCSSRRKAAANLPSVHPAPGHFMVRYHADRRDHDLDRTRLRERPGRDRRENVSPSPSLSHLPFEQPPAIPPRAPLPAQTAGAPPPASSSCKTPPPSSRGSPSASPRAGSRRCS